MHCLCGASWIEECSLALGRRKATLTAAGAQSTMLASFHRSTQVRSIWSAADLWPQPATSSKPAIKRQPAVETRIAEVTISAETRETASLEIPETQYARSGDVNIAYQVSGDGP